MFLNRSSRGMRYIDPDGTKNTDCGEYAREFQLCDGKAYITCNIDGMDDLINSYSITQNEQPSPGLIAYIDANVRHIPFEYPVVLKLCCRDISEAEKTAFVSALSDFYKVRLSDSDRQLRDNLKGALLQLLFGGIFFLLYLFLNSFEAVTLTFQLCMWFFIWEFADMIWMGRRVLRTAKKQAERMAGMRVEFVES